jgi:hypothetical protein
MMATVIEPYVSRVAPSQPSAPNIHLDKSVGEGLQQIGSAISVAGARHAELQRRRDEQAAEIGFMKLNEASQQALIESSRNAPANGAGLAKTFNEKFLTPKTQEFLDGLPPSMREKFKGRSEVLVQQQINNASNKEYEIGSNYSKDFINRSWESSKTGIVLTPTMTKDYVAEMQSLVDSQPNLTAAEREKIKEDIKVQGKTLQIETLMKIDPQVGVAMLGGMPEEERIDFLLPHVMKGTYAAESSSGADVKTSLSGAEGPMQILPSTAREIAVKLGDNDFATAPEEEQKRLLQRDDYAFRFGGFYLREGLVKYHGDVELALIRYNKGDKRVQEFLANGRQWNDKLGPWAKETGPYVRRVFAAMGNAALAGKPMVEYAADSDLNGTRLPAIFMDAKGRQPVARSGLDPQVIDKWERVQGTFGRQVPIVSAYRDDTTNRLAGGAENSQHLYRKAIDVQASGLSTQDRIRLIKLASAAGFKGIGVGDNDLHFDTRADRKSWGYSNGGSIPEWARGVIADHMAGGYGGTDVTKAAPATSTGTAGSGAEGVPRGVASPPLKFTGRVSSELADLSSTALLQLRSSAISAAKEKTEEEKAYEKNHKEKLIARGVEDADSYLKSGDSIIIKPDEVQEFETELLRFGGFDEVNKWRNARYVNASVYEYTKNFGKMTDGEIASVVEMAKKPDPNNPSQQKAIEAAVLTKADEEKKKRHEDPAAYVQSDPDVQVAESNINPSIPTSIERYYDAVAAAQHQIGLPFTPLTKDQATKMSGYISKAFIDGGLSGVEHAETAKALLAELEKNYGGYADDVYVQALSESMDARVKDDTKNILADTFVSWIKANPTVRNPQNMLRNRLMEYREVGELEKATAAIVEEPKGWGQFFSDNVFSIKTRPATPEEQAKQKSMWNIFVDPALKSIPPSGDGPYRGLDTTSMALPGGMIPTEQVAPQPEAVPTETSPARETPPARQVGFDAPKPTFTMPGIKDDDLNALGSNAQDPAVQDRFRNSYGAENLKQALKLIKERVKQ